MKNYILDTNVLLHDPQSLYSFEDNHVWIPIEVLGELDKFKNEMSERGANARVVHRILSELFPNSEAPILNGVCTEQGGRISIGINPWLALNKKPKRWQELAALLSEMDRVDHRVLAFALYLEENQPSKRTVIVTKDINLYIKALSMRLDAEDYRTDKVSALDVESTLPKSIEISANEMQRYMSTGQIQIPMQRAFDLHINEYVTFTNDGRKHIPARYYGQNTFKKLITPQSLPTSPNYNLKPANLGQLCFLDALLDPNISLVTCYGIAGTGKTLLAMAAGLHQVMHSDYDGITISRPVVAMGESIGFLPGSLEEKMRPWLQPIYDSLEILIPAHPVADPKYSGKKKSLKKSSSLFTQILTPATQSQLPVKILKPHERLIQQGLIEIEALCFIRGRSIPRRFFVLDEAQQITPREAKTIVTRMSRGSKLVMVGDPAQIDNPYVDSRSNGLVFTRNRLKGQPIAAHVALHKGERSPLAEIGALLM